jgi:hypothetical protein
MRPRHGGTVRLKLRDEAASAVVYDATFESPEGSWSVVARVAREDGAVELESSDTNASAPPEWLVDLARALLRTAWRDASGAHWPRRIERWRAGRC